MTVGYVAGVADPLAQSTKGAKGLRRRLLSSRVLTLNGWVAFNLPRTVTALGGALLTGLVLVHIYVLTTEPGLPRYFAAYVLGLSAACALAAGAMVFALKPIVPQAG
ncbi:hypothetical protein MAHJHV61_02030 [Mycobacterium avium subsp. hominissuis]|nr:hypothetical protein L839_3525 [Mycobacterium avium MAV_120809_2495]ETZ55099.1 hypothetical protein L838_1095 [Mycobacterium avium MAV_120709_2344]